MGKLLLHHLSVPEDHGRYYEWARSFQGHPHGLNLGGEHCEFLDDLAVGLPGRMAITSPGLVCLFSSLNHSVPFRHSVRHLFPRDGSSCNRFFPGRLAFETRRDTCIARHKSQPPLSRFRFRLPLILCVSAHFLSLFRSPVHDCQVLHHRLCLSRDTDSSPLSAFR
jgi:hypothetical protein